MLAFSKDESPFCNEEKFSIIILRLVSNTKLSYFSSMNGNMILKENSNG